MTAPPLSRAHVQRLWAHAQGLERACPPQRVVGGWLRAIGGIGPYLSLRARHPGLRRAEIDALVRSGQLVVAPGVRGCMWVMPRADLALALHVSREAAEARTWREMARLGVTHAELDRLADSIVTALAAGPLPPDALRRALPDDRVRSLGEAGKKMGHTTTLPTALRLLEWEGQVRRVPPDHRLDTERWHWGLAPDGWVDLPGQPSTRADLAEALAARFLDSAGPGSLEEFMLWSKLPKGLASAAIEACCPQQIQVEGYDTPCFVPGDVLASTLVAEPAVCLLPALDNLLTLRDRVGRVALPEAHDLLVPGMTGQPTLLAEATWLQVRPIAMGGAMVGLWAWDAQADEVVTATFRPLSTSEQADLDDAAMEMATFIRQDFDGVARLFSLDSDKRQAARLAFVRTLATR